MVSSSTNQAQEPHAHGDGCGTNSGGLRNRQLQLLLSLLCLLGMLATEPKRAQVHANRKGRIPRQLWIRCRCQTASPGSTAHPAPSWSGNWVGIDCPPHLPPVSHLPPLPSFWMGMACSVPQFVSWAGRDTGDRDPKAWSWWEPLLGSTWEKVRVQGMTPTLKALHRPHLSWKAGLS